jgi:uncharacterized membrane protein YozB (DUF420 family)
MQSVELVVDRPPKGTPAAKKLHIDKLIMTNFHICHPLYSLDSHLVQRTTYTTDKVMKNIYIFLIFTHVLMSNAWILPSKGFFNDFCTKHNVHSTLIHLPGRPKSTTVDGLKFGR